MNSSQPLTRIWRTRSIAVLAAFGLLLAACTSGEEEDGATNGPTEGRGVDLPEDSLVPTIVLLGPAPSAEQAQFEANDFTLRNWESLGLSVEHVAVPDFPSFAGSVAQGEWHVASFGYLGNLSRIDPDQLLSRPLMCQFGGEGGSNYGNWCLDAYDEVVERSKQEFDQSARRELVFRAQEIQALDLPYVVSFYPSEVAVYNKDAYTSVVPAVGTGLYNFWNFIGAEPTGDDKTYRLGVQGALRSMNPMNAGDYLTDIELHHLIYDSLAKIAPDGKPVEWAAESWQIEDDTHIVVSLRDDMQFTDGEPVTAEDVKFSFDYTKEWEVGLYQNALAPIESVEIIDDLTLRFALTEPTSTVLAGAFTQINILPKHVWENVVEDEELSHPSEWGDGNFVGSGPYILQSVSANEAVELVRNNDHFDAPASERFVTRFYTDMQSVFRAMQSGEVYFHQAGRLTPSMIEQSQDESELSVEEQPGITVRWNAFSMREDSPFRDWNFRHALAHTYDYQTFVEVMLNGHGHPGVGTIGPGNEFWYNDQIPHEELAVDEPHWHQFDLAKARQFLADAGYRWDDEGRLHYPEGYTPQEHHPLFGD